MIYYRDNRNCFNINRQTVTTISGAITGVVLPYSVPTALATAVVCLSVSKTHNCKTRKKMIKYSEMYFLTKEFSDKFNKI